MFEFYRRVGPWYWLGWRIVRSQFAIWHGLKVLGIENLPLTGGAILACNHISHLDPPAVGVATPRRIRYVAKEELFRQFFLSWYLPTIGVIPIKRGGGGGTMLEIASEAIAKGDLVTLFPEGTRSRTGFPGKPRTGVIALAAMTGAPLIPARISGTYDCMPPGRKLPRPGPVQVAFGEPIRWPPGKLDMHNREQMVEEAQRVLDTIMSLPGWHPRLATRRDGDGEDTGAAVASGED